MEQIYESDYSGQEVDAAVGASRSGIPQQITQINTRVSALEEDVDDLSGLPQQVATIGSNLDNLNCVLTGDYFTESVTAGPGYSYITRKGRYFMLKKGIPYTFTFTSESALTAPIYIRLMHSETDNNDFIVSKTFPADTTSYTFTFKPAQDYPKAFIGYGCAVATDITVSATMDESSVLDKLDDLESAKEEVDNNLEVLAGKLDQFDTRVGIYSSDLFELGNITINNSGWSYLNSSTRVRTKRDTSFHLYVGDIISLSDYTDARYYLGWKLADGTYKSQGWLTNDFSVAEEADYVIVLCNLTDTAQSSKDALFSLLDIKSANNNVVLLERINDLKDSEPFDGIELAIRRGSKYVKYTTGAYTSTGTYFDVYELENNNYGSISINCGYSDAGATAIAFYNGIPSADTYMLSDSVQGFANNTIYSADVPKGCKYIAVTNRNTIVAEPTITLRHNKVDAAYSAAGKFDSLKDDCEDELLTTLTVTSSTNTTVGSDYYSFKAGDVLKVVCEKKNDIANYATFRLGEDWLLTGSNNLVEGTQFIPIPYAMTTKLYLVTRNKDYVSVSIYKVSRADLAELAPQYFFNTQNSRNGQKGGTQEIKWLTRGSYYITPNPTDGFYYLKKDSANNRIGTELIYAVNPKVTVTLQDNTNYRYGIYCVKNLSDMTYGESGWITDSSKTLQLYCQAFCVMIGHPDYSPITQADIEASGISIVIEHEYQEPVATYRQYAEVSEQIEEVAAKVEDIPAGIGSKVTSTITKANGLINKEFLNHPCYGHLFIETIGQEATPPAIPCQSLFDVDATARLGFKYIETNVQTTSDGVLIPIHGSSGTFRSEVVDLNGDFTYADTVINSVTYEWIQQNLRYKTKYAKHRTTIPTLEEVFKECKAHGMSVMMTYNDASYALAKKYFGDNFIAYNGNRDSGFTGTIMVYSPLATKDEILAQCDRKGAPYVHFLNVAAFNTFYGNGTLADLAKAVHDKGCLLGLAGCYHSVLDNIAFFEAGGDVSASGFYVNDFPQGNICNLKGDVDFSDFTITNGTTTDGVLTLASGGTISSGDLSSIYLGKGFLRIRFNGTLKVTSFGHSKYRNVTLTSDGQLTKWFSTYFLEQTPTFNITATESTEIYMIDYKASKV